MALTDEEVRKVAHLARLQLSEQEIEEYREQLSDVLAYVDQLDQLDLERVAPTTHAVAQNNVWRTDQARPSLTLEEVLYNAPAQVDDQFLIQAVLTDE
ncbi:MAG TPA: Asp-tRNA(Asn)/Glu-tRNA(Gln) amidotransferase subunit GatC [Candidatus Binatia bacterium]|nr:Asp-tRNA(Asn)/Glu-tRNA(Gln) amidotransferase subunit GatC [Candidatus Binatia bacterium]